MPCSSSRARSGAPTKSAERARAGRSGSGRCRAASANSPWKCRTMRSQPERVAGGRHEASAWRSYADVHRQRRSRPPRAEHGRAAARRRAAGAGAAARSPMPSQPPRPRRRPAAAAARAPCTRAGAPRGRSRRPTTTGRRSGRSSRTSSVICRPLWRSRTISRDAARSAERPARAGQQPVRREQLLDVALRGGRGRR